MQARGAGPDGHGYAPSSPMPRLDQLPADQKAVLQLLLKQGRSYEDIAGLLRLERRAVRERALGALHSLGAEAGADLPPDRQDQVADHLLGQQDPAQQAATREFLAGSAPGRRWAAAVAAELAPIAPAGLPEIPAEPDAGRRAEPGTRGSRRDPHPGPPRSSRLGGAILLLTVLLAAGAAGFWFLRSDDEPAAGSEPAATQATTAAPEGAVEAQINLRPTRAGARAVGIAQIVSANGNRGLAVAGQDLRAGDYAIWLYTSETEAQLLGFAPQVTRDGVLQGLAQSLPANYARFRELVVSRERVTDANRDAERTRPGTIVLRGPISQAPPGG